MPWLSPELTSVGLAIGDGAKNYSRNKRLRSLDRRVDRTVSRIEFQIGARLMRVLLPCRGARLMSAVQRSGAPRYTPTVCRAPARRQTLRHRQLAGVAQAHYTPTGLSSPCSTTSLAPLPALRRSAGALLPTTTQRSRRSTALAAATIPKVAVTMVTEPKPPEQSSFTPSPTKLFCWHTEPSGLG